MCTTLMLNKEYFIIQKKKLHNFGSTFVLIIQKHKISAFYYQYFLINKMEYWLIQGAQRKPDKLRTA